MQNIWDPIENLTALRPEARYLIFLFENKHKNFEFWMKVKNEIISIESVSQRRVYLVGMFHPRKYHRFLIIG